MNQLSAISPVSDADAARTVRASTLTELAGSIVATPVPPSAPRTEPLRVGRRRLRIAAIVAPVAAGVAAAVILAAASPPAPARGGSATARTGSASTRPGGHVTRGGIAHLTADLKFTSTGGYITVTVVNPLADPSRYRAEFTAHHLDISLTLVPVSPSLVGTLVYIGESAGSNEITPITANGRCFTGGGGAECPVGVRIPDGYRGHADITFGRAAKPGEQYESTAPVTAPGEAMQGLAFRGKTVAEVLRMLRQRHVTVPVYNDNGKLLRTAPGSWYVYDADPWAPGQVMLSVGPAWPQPLPSTPSPGAPVPSSSAKP